jgi:hypothetical protein
MRTNRNFFSKLSKATLIVSLAFTTLISVSCQNAARQSFHYKPDFIKQMVYQVSSEFMTRTGFSSQAKNNKGEAAAILINYTVAVKSVNHSSSNDADLAYSLTAAASLNAPVVSQEVIENDNALEFLTEAAKLNAPVAEMEADQDITLESLTSAAQLNTELAQDNNNDETFELLIDAARINTSIATEETSQDELLVSMAKAADLNISVAE